MVGWPRLSECNFYVAEEDFDPTTQSMYNKTVFDNSLERKWPIPENKPMFQAVVRQIESELSKQAFLAVRYRRGNGRAYQANSCTRVGTTKMRLYYRK
jgi:hypothetical protein